MANGVFFGWEGLVLYLNDDGQELPADFEAGFGGKSIGMALVKSLVEDQLEGEFSWNTDGYKFKISFPVHQAA